MIGVGVGNRHDTYNKSGVLHVACSTFDFQIAALISSIPI